MRNFSTSPRLAHAAAEDTPIHQAAYQAPSPTRNLPFSGIQESREFWRSTVPIWRDVTTEDFLSYRWSIANTVQEGHKLHKFLSAVLPDEVPLSHEAGTTQSREELMEDIFRKWLVQN